MTLIDRDALILKRRFMVATGWSVDHDGYAVPVKDIYDAPTIEASPVVHGQWINKQGGFWETAACSNCAERFPTVGIKPNYCPNCGADMREDGGEKDD